MKPVESYPPCIESLRKEPNLGISPDWKSLLMPNGKVLMSNVPLFPYSMTQFEGALPVCSRTHKNKPTSLLVKFVSEDGKLACPCYYPSQFTTFSGKRDIGFLYPCSSNFFCLPINNFIGLFKKAANFIISLKMFRETTDSEFAFIVDVYFSNTSKNNHLKKIGESNQFQKDFSFSGVIFRKSSSSIATFTFEHIETLFKSEKEAILIVQANPSNDCVPTISEEIKEKQSFVLINCEKSKDSPTSDLEKLSDIKPIESENQILYSAVRTLYLRYFASNSDISQI